MTTALVRAAPAAAAAPGERRGPSAGSGVLLGAGRAIEQAAYGVTMLVLAARMEPSTFGPVAALFVANSVALTLADLGVAHDLLRAPPGASYSRVTVGMMRAVNLGVAGAAVCGGLVVGGEAGRVVGAAGLLWVTAGEAYLRQAAAIRTGRIRRHVLVDGITATVLVAAVVLWGRGEVAAGVAGLALIGHHALVAVLLPMPSGTLGDGARGRPLGFLANHSLGFLTRNADYVLVGPLLGPVAFASYVLGFRVAAAPSAPLGAAVLRWGLARFAAEDDAARTRTHRRAVAVLTAAGLVAALLTMGVAALLPRLIGSSWEPAAAVALVLAVALPWRFAEGFVGALGFAVGAGHRLVRFEVVRLGVTVVALVLAGLAGPAAFVATVVVLTVLSVTAGHLVACRAAGVGPSPWLLGAVPVALVAAPVLALATIGPLVPGG